MMQKKHWPPSKRSWALWERNEELSKYMDYRMSEYAAV